MFYHYNLKKVIQDTLSIDGTETFDILGNIEPRGDLTVSMTRANGEKSRVQSNFVD